MWKSINHAEKLNRWNKLTINRLINH